MATRERDFAREESARTREAMDELETKVSVFLLSYISAISIMMPCFFYIQKSTGDGSGDNKCASDEDDDEGDGRDEKEVRLPEKTPPELGKVGTPRERSHPEEEVGIPEKSEPPSTEKAELSESLRFFEQFQSSSSSSEAVVEQDASTRQSGRRANRTVFVSSTPIPIPTPTPTRDSDRTRNKSSSSTSEAPFDDSGFIKPVSIYSNPKPFTYIWAIGMTSCFVVQSIKPNINNDEEWAERWEREQWERKHRGVGSYERQSVDRKVTCLCLRTRTPAFVQLPFTVTIA